MIHPKKKVCACARVHVCTRVRIILVLVCGIMYHIRTYLVSARLPRYVYVETYVPGLHPRPPKKNRRPSKEYVERVLILFERSEFPIDTSQKKSLRVCTCARVHVCTCARVHACSNNLDFSVWYYVPHTYVSRISSAPKIRICRYVCTRATSPPPKKEQKASLIFDPMSECNLSKFFSSFESASRICSRERKLR